MSYKISIVAGIYFTPELSFKRFLDACLDQTLDNLEFIFLLDSPNDVKSRQILREYEDKFNNNKNNFIIIENDKNLGVVNTYNKGINLSNGDYIVIVDTDDFFDNNWLECMYNYMISHKDIEILAPRIIIGYLGKFDILYSILGNDNPDDTGLMFTKETLNKYKDKFQVNITSYQGFYAKAEKLPLSYGSFYYYVRTNENATSSNKFLDNYNKEKNVEFDLYSKIVKNEIKEALKDFTSLNININSCSKEQLIKIAKPYSNLDNSGFNDFSYEELKKI